MAKADKSATLVTAVAAGDDGSTLLLSNVLLDVGETGEPQAIYITAIYGVATVAGTFHFFQTDDWTNDPFTAGDANHMLDLYLSVTGDGATGIKIGPITKDLLVASDATATCGAGGITITYEAIGTV